MPVGSARDSCYAGAMGELLTGYTVFHWVATWSHPFFDVFFRIVTDLGYPLFYFLVIAPLFWVVDRRRALVLFLLMAVSGLLNSEAKLWFDTPRPDPELIRVLDLRPIRGGSRSFPSGHAQIAVVFWLYLAFWARRRWFTVLAVSAAVAISFSRIYLGVHFPLDIAGGLLIGGATLALVPSLERWARADFSMPVTAVLLAAAVGSALLLTASDPALIVASGCLLAFLALGILPPARATLADRREAAIVVAFGLAVQVAGFAVLGRLLPVNGGAGAPLGLGIAALWLVALWIYPHGVAVVLARRAVAAEPIDAEETVPGRVSE